MQYLCRHWARCTSLGNHSPSGLAPRSGHRGLNRTKHHNKILSLSLSLSLLSFLSVVDSFFLFRGLPLSPCLTLPLSRFLFKSLFVCPPWRKSVAPRAIISDTRTPSEVLGEPTRQTTPVRWMPFESKPARSRTGWIHWQTLLNRTSFLLSLLVLCYCEVRVPTLR